jgi:hypothetical protein
MPLPAPSVLRAPPTVQVRSFDCECFLTKIHFHGEDLLALRPTPKLEEHPVSAVRDCNEI